MTNSNVPPAENPVPPEIPDDELYKHCFTGYQYRDQLIPQEFSSMTQCFVLLLTLMGMARSLPIDAQWIPQLLAEELIPRFLATVIGVAGAFALFAYSFDLHANTTCKRRLREMMIQMERGQTTTEDVPKESLKEDLVYYWHFIEHRSLSRLEKWVHKRSGPRASATGCFRLAANVYVGAWIILALLVIVMPKFMLLGK